MSRQRAESISGNRSVMPPGLMPVPCKVAFPRRARILDLRDLGRLRRVDPADRRHDVLARLEQADHRRRARKHRRVDDAVGLDRAVASRSFVAGTPRGAMPAELTDVLGPTLSGLCTQHPTSSRSGCASTPMIDSCPTSPVAHWITRYVISRLSSRSADGARLRHHSSGSEARRSGPTCVRARRHG